MKTFYLFISAILLSYNALYGQSKELSDEQYAILNKELSSGAVYEQTNFAYYWSNYLNFEWLTSQGGFCVSDGSAFGINEFSEHIDEKTLANLRSKISNEIGPRTIDLTKLKNAKVKLSNNYDSNKIRYISAPIIEGDFAVMLDRLLWYEKINFYQKTPEGTWKKFCEVYVLESASTWYD